MRKFKTGKEDFEPNVGETFIYNCKKFKCVLDASSIKCNRCYFLGIPQCSDVRCIGHFRKDCNSVRFVEVKEEPKCEYELYVNGYRLVGVERKTLDDYKALIENLNINSGDIFEIKEMKTVHKEVTKDVNERIDTYEKALKYIGSARRDKMVDSSVAICRLLIIAAAWNKADGFVVDWSNDCQDKFTPRFGIGEDMNGKIRLICLGFSYNNPLTNGGLCFKTPERAEQFGTQFIDLWNDFLLNK